MRIDPKHALLIASLGCYSGCYSGVQFTPEADVEEGNEPGANDADPERGEAEPQGPSVDEYSMMRLTRAEYDHTVADLLGDQTRPGLGFALDEKLGPFDANGTAPASEVMLQDYLDAAEELASTAVADVPSLTGCTANELGSDACAHRFIDEFGMRAYRRPLNAEEHERHFTVFSTGVQLRGFDHGIELIVRAMLQSPNFLYRIEVGEPVAESPGIARLSDWELASRLSYFLWDSMPDDELFNVAEAGQLQDPEEFERQVRRLLDSPKAEPMVAAFHTQLMGLGSRVEKDPEIFPEFTDTLVDSMRQEVGLFATDIVLHGDSQISSLLASSHTFVDAQLAAVYGIEHPSDDPDAFVRVELDPATRSGLLTQPGHLAATSHAEVTSAVLRGRFIRTEILCQDIQPPPVDVDDAIPTFDPSASPRQQFEELTGKSDCVGCHVMMNDLGFAFDGYDPIGAPRTEISGFDVDASGTLVGTDVDGDFNDAIDLSTRLAGSQMVQSCIARQWFRFGIGRNIDAEFDAQALVILDEAASLDDIREIITAVTATDAFRYRAWDSNDE